MKTATALELAKKIEKDCRKAQAYCQLSQSVIQDFKHTVNWGSVRKTMVLRGPEPTLTADNKEVQDCLEGMEQVGLDCQDSSTCSKAAQKTVASFKRTVDYNYAIHRLVEAANRVREYRMGIRFTPPRDLANLPPEAFNQIIDRTGGRNEQT